MIKFRTERTSWGVVTKITPVEVERESDSSLWINGRRSAKTSQHETYHDTWDQAHAHLMERANQNCESARYNLQTANGKLGNVKGMKRPE
jgi:hypothetical protein